MCKVQEKAKNERQNDDYATANTNPNSPLHHAEAHRVRRRLSQTISSRSCLLIAIALASLSAHACDDTVELQVTCDSSETPWVVKSSDANNETTVTVGSCIGGRVKDVAQVKGKDIDDKGIVICSESKVCYHLKWISGDQIEVKNCDNYDDPNRTYYCDNGVLKFRNDKSHDITASDTCFSSNNVSHNYGCDGNNIVRKTPCPNGCADDHQGCKQDPDLPDKCTADGTLICKDGALFDCRNGKYIEGGKACNDKGEVVFCKENELKQEMHTCAGDQVVWCNENIVESAGYTCEGNQVVWCKQDESGKYGLHTSACYPNTNEANKYVCKSKQSTNTCTECSDEGNCVAQGTDADQKVSCKEDLTGITPSTGTTGIECQYCYNEYVNNTPVSIEKLGCDGCVPNEYNFGDSSESIFNAMNSICHNGKESEFDNIENRNFLFVPEFDSDGLWEFALNVTPALSKDQLVVPANDQSKQTWWYYNCHNDDAMEFLNKFTDIDDADKFVETLNELKNTTGKHVIDSIVPKTCCDDENSYYITQTGYRYYSVEKCTNIRLHDTNKYKIINTNFSAYAYTPELNGSLIGTEHDLLAKDYACLEVRDNPEDTNDVRRMMFIKQQANGDQQSQGVKSKHGIYKAFECPENYKCDESLSRRLCISNEPSQSNSNCKCKNNTGNIYTIICDNKTIAACPKGTTPHIVGDSGVESKCDGQSNLKLDQIRCVYDGKFTPEQ